MRVVGVRRARADLNVAGERLPIAAERAPELGIVVRHTVGVARASAAEVVARVVPDDGDLSGDWIERELREELTAHRAVVIHPHRWTPRRAAVVGVADEDVRVVALVLLLEGVDEVDATIVRSAAAVPRKAGFRVDRAIRLGRDEVEPADVSIGDEHAIAETGRPEPIGIDVHERLAAALPALG